MIAVGGIYNGKANRRYLGLYNYQDDIYSLAPLEIRDSRYVAHVSYQRGGRKGGVNIFELPRDSPDPSSFMKVKKDFELVKREVLVAERDNKKEGRITRAQLREAGRKYGIRAEVSSCSERETREILDLVNADIVYFCGENEAKDPREPSVRIVDKIIPVTTIQEIEPAKMITGGKQWIVPECCLEGNKDYGQGCITAWTPGEGATFDGKTFTNWFSDPWGECAYPCYAERKHRCPPKTVYKYNETREREELLGACKLDFQDSTKPLGRPLDILRFGKRTEVWTPWSKDHFIRTLEIMADIRKQGAKTRGVITTRFIPSSRNMSRLLKLTGSVIGYGIGFWEYEKGAYAHGATNEFRQEQAMKFRESGVNSFLYTLIIAHLPPTERELNILKFSDYGRRIPLQLLPLRFRRKDITLKLTGESWETLKGDKKQLSLELGNYGSYVKEANELVVKRIHPFWLDLVKKNQGRIRMCHHDDHRLYCGGCFMRKGLITDDRIKDKE